jgi:hypothetical protein
VSWDAVRSAVESGICVSVGNGLVQVGDRLEEVPVFRLRFEAAGCPGAARAPSPALQAVTAALAESAPLLLPVAHYFGRSNKSSLLHSRDVGSSDTLRLNLLDVESIETATSGPLEIEAANVPLVKGEFCSSLFENPLALEALMPAVTSALASHGVNCPDCPVPAAVDRTPRVSYDDLLRHIRALYRPARFENDEPVFAGPLSSKDVEGFDPRLALGAHVVATQNLKLTDAVAAIVDEAGRAKAFRKQRKTLTDAQKLAYYQTFIESQLASDWRAIDGTHGVPVAVVVALMNYRQAIDSRAPGVLRQLGLECDGCP